MIYCNLAGLMANKKVNISDLSRDTKISRTTLTGLYYNEYKGVQMETVNTLCKYFNTGIEMLFMFSKYDFYVKAQHSENLYYDVDSDDKNIACGGEKVIVQLIIKLGNISKVCDIDVDLIIFENDTSCDFEINLDYIKLDSKEIRENNAFMKTAFNALNQELKSYVENKIVDEILDEYVSQMFEMGYNVSLTNNLW